MPYVYRHFIPQNTAPSGAQKIGVYDGNGKKVYSIPLGGLTPPNTPKRYSFCALADVHITHETANEDFQRALTYANANCDFTCIAGDLTDNASVESQLATYKTIVDTCSPNKPVYAITGNHENYNKYVKDYLEKYTGHPLYYSFTKGNDVFIMVGHYGAYAGDGIGWLATETWSQEELQWLYETLEANRNKRCFVFTHVLPHEHRVGNPNNLYVTAGKPLLWYTNDGGIGQAFVSLLRHYKNTILFHGHSHTRFWLQELDPKANYSDDDGYRSVHIPSLSVPRDPAADGVKLTDIYAESEGYIVDVYDDCIVLNGRDFIDNDADGHGIGIAIYKVDTTLVEIPADTFTDSTGTITT
jgi:Icc-related predicted phosphoesterase